MNGDEAVENDQRECGDGLTPGCHSSEARNLVFPIGQKPW